jgi:hypothetical protein
MLLLGILCHCLAFHDSIPLHRTPHLMMYVIVAAGNTPGVSWPLRVDSPRGGGDAYIIERWQKQKKSTKHLDVDT